MENYQNKTKDELIQEIEKLNKQIAECDKDEIIKNYEEELKISADKYKSLYDNAPFSYQSLDINGNFIDVNPTWLNTLGYKKDEVIGKWFGDFLRKDFVEHFKKNFPVLKKQGYLNDVQFSIRKKSGEYIYVSFEGFIDTLEGKFKQTYCTFKDITEPKIAEELIQQSESNLNALINTREESIWSLDKNFNFLIFNKYFAETYLELFNIELKVGLNALEIISPDLLEFWKTKYEKALNGEKVSFEFSNKHNDEKRYFDVNLNPIISDGLVIGLSAISIDITERKQVETALYENEKIFRNFMEHSPIYVFFKDENIRSVRLSKNYESMLGKPIKDLLGKNMFDLFPSELAKSMVEDDQKILRKNKVITVEEEFNGRNYRTIKFPIHIDNKPRFLAGYTIDITNQKKAEDDLKESEERLNLVIKGSNDAPWDWDLIKDELYYSPQWWEQLGFEPNELPADSDLWERIMNPEDKEHVDTILGNALKTDTQSYEVEFRLKHKNGRYVPILSRGYITRNSEGEPIRLSGSNMDLTEKKEVQNELIKKNQFIQTVLDNIPIGIALNKMDEGTATYVNQKFQEIYGWPEEKLKDIELFFKLVYPDEAFRNKLQKTVMEDINSGDISRMHWEGLEVTKEDGSIGIINAVNIPLYEQNTMISTVIDITAQKLLERALKASENHNRILFDYAPIPIWEEDFSLVKKAFEELKEKGVDDFRSYFEHNPYEVNRLANLVKIIAVNEKSNEFYGVKNITQLTTKLTDWFDEDSFLTFENELIALAEGKTKYEDDIKIKDLNGESKHLHFSLNIPPSSIKTFDRVIVSFLDITERKQAEEELNNHRANLEELIKERTAELTIKESKILESNQAMRFLLEDVNDARQDLIESNKKISEANKDIESFAYSVSHDLKSPLRAINGYTKVLLEDFSDIFTDEKKELMDLIIKNSMKMNILIDDLLRFSRAGRDELDISEFNLSRMVKDVINTVSEINKEQTIISKIQENVLINADIAAIKQVLHNLIGNAVKFSGQKEKTKIEFGSKIINGKPTYYFKDNGMGFEMKYADKLFEVFQRLHGSEKIEGTGIGLSLVNKIINKHGGKVWAESEPGKGSTFYFTLPV